MKNIIAFLIFIGTLATAAFLFYVTKFRTDWIILSFSGLGLALSIMILGFFSRALSESIEGHKIHRELLAAHKTTYEEENRVKAQDRINSSLDWTTAKWFLWCIPFSALGFYCLNKLF